MIEPFEYSENFEEHRIFTIYPNLKIQNSPAFYLLLRGITGTLKIEQTFRNEIFNQEVDLLNERSIDASSREVDIEKKIINADLKPGILNLIEVLKIKCKSDIEILPKYISETYTLEDLSRVLSDRATIHRNKDFFKSLNYEFSNFYYFTHINSHTVAFLHLYRILEFVSYSFPLMYAVSTKDFNKSFNELKSLFSGDKDQGELNVFKKFINNIVSAEKDYKKLTIDIFITSELPEYNERIYKTILRICSREIFDESKSVENSKLSIKFPEFSSFIITLRNRFFHLKNSQDSNMHSIDIVDSDYFFSLINKKCAYFLSLITFVIIKKSYFEN